MRARLNLIGEKFGRLTVTRESHRNNVSKLFYVCRCDCGTEKVIAAPSLKSGDSKSCGCLQREMRTTHGFTKEGKTHPIYRAWNGMRKRCSNPNCQDFKNYGGRGIRVCAEWNSSFEAFLRDMGPTWQLGLSIDRTDNNGNYDKENCRWATKEEQANNKRPRKMKRKTDSSLTLSYIPKAANNGRFKQAGEKNNGAILTDDKVRDIHQLAESGCTQRAIGKLYGLHQAYISAIRTGKRWPHIYAEIIAKRVVTPDLTGFDLDLNIKNKDFAANS